MLLLSHFSRAQLCVTPETAIHQAPQSLGFSRQEHWSGLPFPSTKHESEKWKWSHSVVSKSSQPHGLQPTRPLRPWDFPGKSAGVGYHCLLHTSIWDECNCTVVWVFFSIAFLWDWNENWPFPGHCWVFQICWHTECSTFTASSFKIWNSWTGIPSPPLALFVVMLSKATWLDIPGCLALGEWSHHHAYLGSEDLFCTVLLCILATSS